MIGTSDGQTFEGEWDYIQSRFGPMHTNPPAEEGHASFTLADVLEHPTVQSALANPKIDRTHDVPYESGASKDPEDTTTHIDKRIPSEITLSGVKIDPAIPANIHEQVEREAMERLIKSGMPQDKAYEMAHHQYAEVAEDNWYRAHGINIKDANDWWFKQDKITEHENPENPPPNLYTKPYPHNKVEGSPSTAAQYMTHEAEGPNPVAPFINMVKRRAAANLKEFGQKLLSPEFQTVLGTTGTPTAPALFGGVFAPEARILAENMEGAGMSAHSIKYMTGLERGVEGIWRKEFSDVGAKLDLSKLTGSPYRRDVRIGRLGDVYEHSELYTHYPDARKINISVEKLDPGTKAEFHSDINKIKLAPYLTGEEARSSLLHELQHWIQHQEGFDITHPSDFSPELQKVLNLSDYELYHRTAPEVEARNVQTREKYIATERQRKLARETEDVLRSEQLRTK